MSKVLSDLGRLGNRETPAVLNLLVIEDLAMAVYLPVVAALIVGGSIEATVSSVAIALVAVAVILFVALRSGRSLSDMLVSGSDETLLLTVFGAHPARRRRGPTAARCRVRSARSSSASRSPGRRRSARCSSISPLRDLFAATFFLFFSFQIDAGDLVDVAIPALCWRSVTSLTKVVTGWYAAGRVGAGTEGRMRAGTVLIARGEFSIVIAALGARLADGPRLGALAAAYVLVTAIMGPVAAKFSDRIPHAVVRW